MKKDSYKLILRIVLFLYMFLNSNVIVNAQSNDNFRKLQKNSLDQIHHKRSLSKINPLQEQQELGVNDSIFKLFDVDIDLTLGEISLDMSWGDPVKNPQIRGNKASNLYGPVRYNADGSVRWHRGFDYYAPKGTPVYSVGSGVVSLVQKHPDYGLCVLITHKRPKKTYYSFYAHLSSVLVKYGEDVHKGTMIGKSGTTGNAYDLTDQEEHLHFEYRTSPKHSDRKQANPNAILKTKFYSADPKNKWQANVGVVKKGGQSLFE
ncbi:MAG: M23 family metallopeptidase [Rikenellaceae bacterium]|nr:M23 family metallopeptidase [Rikenellaceae bacterium]